MLFGITGPLGAGKQTLVQYMVKNQQFLYFDLMLKFKEQLTKLLTKTGQLDKLPKDDVEFKKLYYSG